MGKQLMCLGVCGGPGANGLHASVEAGDAGAQGHGGCGL